MPFIFCFIQPVIQPVRRFSFVITAAKAREVSMQMDLALMGRIDEAGVVPHSLIVQIADYREAVRMCWIYRRAQRMTQETLAERVPGMYASHVSDYLDVNEFTKNGQKRRSLPAHLIRDFRAACGNKIVTQWLAHQEGLTVMESVINERKNFLASAA
jgi:hypothetical protein